VWNDFTRFFKHFHTSFATGMKITPNRKLNPAFQYPRWHVRHIKLVGHHATSA
tara:strand:- start:5264 stop:5422 length:159 start_codon:yes stop_codon:yes gene_type:complete